MAAAMLDWASLTRFITSSSSLAAAWGVISGGLTMALLEWLILTLHRTYSSIIMSLSVYPFQWYLHTEFHKACKQIREEQVTHFKGLSPNMTPFKASARDTYSWPANSTKAKRVGWVSSPAMRTNFTSPTCLKNSSSCSAVVVYERKCQTNTERRLQQ